MNPPGGSSMAGHPYAGTSEAGPSSGQYAQQPTATSQSFQPDLRMTQTSSTYDHAQTAGPSTSAPNGSTSAPKITIRNPSRPPGTSSGSGQGGTTSPAKRTLRRGGQGIPRSENYGKYRQSGRLSARSEQGSGSKVRKVKLKIKAGGDSGRKSPFLGEYDRELDENPDDPLAFEEQFILRVPEKLAGGPNGLRELVKGKGKGVESVEFKFLDSRRAAFKMNGVTFASKLVDLPCIVESQKTFDNRHLFKVADISQMLVVDHQVKEESSITSDSLKIDDYIWPHGLTPPLRHVRKRRFRKRLSRRAIEVVEEQVEDLLKKDGEAEATSFDLIDAHPDPEMPDSYYIDYDPDAQWQRGGTASEFGGSEMYDDPGSVAMSNTDDWGDGEGDYGSVVGGEGEGGYDDDGESAEGGMDDELVAALMEQMEGGGEGSGASDDGLSASEDDEDEDAEKSEDDEETSDKKAKIRQLTSEIKALEGAIEKKRAGFTGGNPIIQKRFDETIAGLQADVKTKMEHRQGIIDELDQVIADRREHRQTSLAASGAKGSAGATPGKGTNAEGDVDMGDGDEDAEGEEEDVSTPMAGRTPGGVSTPGTPAEDAELGADDDEDLFGDSEAEGSGVEGDEGTEGEGGDEEGEGEDGGGGGGGSVQGQEDDDDLGLFGEGNEGEDEDEMAAMLRAELGDLPSSPARDQATVDADAAVFADAMKAEGVGEGMGMDEQDQVAGGDNAALADDLSALQVQGMGSSPAPDMGGFRFGGVEGGVGMRRLASGMMAGDDDDDEDSSDEDSDD